MELLERLYHYMSASYVNTFFAIAVAAIVFMLIKTCLSFYEGVLTMLATICSGIVLVVVLAASVPCLCYQTADTFKADQKRMEDICEATIYEAMGGRNTAIKIAQEFKGTGISFPSFTSLGDLRNMVDETKLISDHTTKTYQKYLID